MKDSFAVIEFGGTQHMVSVGDVIDVNHIDAKAGDKITIDSVLLMQDKEEVKVGTPTLPLVVKAEVVRHYKGVKIDILKYKAKARYRRSIGHRQFLTELKITGIAKPSVPKTKTTKK